MMRPLFLIPSTRGGGAEHVVVSWVNGLRRSGHDPHMATFLPTDAPKGIDVANWHQLDRSGGALRWLSSGRDIRRLVDETKPDVLVSSLTVLNILSARLAGRIGCPVVICEHTVASRLLRSGGPKGRIKRFLAGRAYREADAAIAVSHAVATDLICCFGIASDRVWVLPNPVVDDDASPSEAPSPPGRIRLLFVGRLVQPKQPLRVLETGVELRRRGVDVSICFVGDGPLHHSIVATAGEAGLLVEMRPFDPRWPDQQQSETVVMLPSDIEGFGNVLVQAAIAGIPAVAPSQALGVGDAIVPGVTGVLALSPRAGHLADAAIEAVSVNGVSMAPWRARFGEASAAHRLGVVLETVIAEWASRA